MRVLHVHRVRGIGGSERHLLTLLPALAERGVEPAYMWAVYVLAAAGLLVAPRAFVWLALLLLAYQTAAAVVFVGATRYRVAWDFLVVLLATAALARAGEWVQERRAHEPVRA